MIAVQAMQGQGNWNALTYRISYRQSMMTQDAVYHMHLCCRLVGCLSSYSAHIYVTSRGHPRFTVFRHSALVFHMKIYR